MSGPFGPESVEPGLPGQAGRQRAVPVPGTYVDAATIVADQGRRIVRAAALLDEVLAAFRRGDVRAARILVERARVEIAPPTGGVR